MEAALSVTLSLSSLLLTERKVQEKIPMGGAVCCTNAETIIHDPESRS
jgi:hypothetical protein